MPLHVVRDDITRMKVDAIVNTANPKPIVGFGTDSNIYKAAGAEALQLARQKIGCIERGDVGVTEAYRLRAKWIFHAVSVHWNGGRAGEEKILRSCYRKSLEKAVSLKCKSIAFPLLAAGSYEFPLDRAMQIALDEIAGFLFQSTHCLDVYLVLYDDKAIRLYSRINPDIETDIDDAYVEKNIVNESIYSSTDLEHVPKPRKKPRKLKVLTGKENFQKTLDFFIYRYIEDPQHNKISGIYKSLDGEMSKQTFSKIRSGKNGYHPARLTVLLLAVGLRLTSEDTDTLLEKAGYSPDPQGQAEQVIRNCIRKGRYSIEAIKRELQKKTGSGEITGRKQQGR